MDRGRPRCCERFGQLRHIRIRFNARHRDTKRRAPSSEIRVFQAGATHAARMGAFLMDADGGIGAIIGQNHLERHATRNRHREFSAGHEGTTITHQRNHLPLGVA